MNRILFLVDTKGLGKQAERKFLAYRPNDDNHSFSELYGVHRLKSSFIPSDAQVCISTIQRMHAILRGEELDESTEEELLMTVVIGNFACNNCTAINKEKHITLVEKPECLRRKLVLHR